MGKRISGLAESASWRMARSADGWDHVRRGARLSVQAVSDLLFPPGCLACDVELEAPQRVLCNACRGSLDYPPGGSCAICAAPLPLLGERTANCIYCLRRNYRFDSTLALGLYRGRLRDAVLRTKRACHESLVRVLGQILGGRVRERFAGVVLDGVVPVPMHWLRRLRRGIPAAELLAEAVAEAIDGRRFNDLLRCRSGLRKQGTLLPAERFQNVAGAFAVSSRYDVRGARLLLVDDVMTTGATANAIARVLRRGGASEVHVAVLARGTGEGN